MNGCIEDGRMHAIVRKTSWKTNQLALINLLGPYALRNVTVSTSNLGENFDGTVWSTGNVTSLDAAVHRAKLSKRDHPLVEP